MFRRRAAALLVALLAPCALAHDPSAYGGLFRSSDGGRSWLPADGGLFVGGALSVAFAPGKNATIWYGTDNRLMGSVNGGRDWVEAARGLTGGAVFALGYSRGGGSVVAATTRGILVRRGESDWVAVWTPPGTSPAYAISPGAEDGTLLLAGPGGLFGSIDGGRTWSATGSGLPAGPVTALQGIAGRHYAIVAGKVHASADGGRSWLACGGLPGDVAAESIDAGSAAAGRLLAAGGNRVFASADGCVRWAAAAQSVPEPPLRAHAVLGSGDGAILLATSRGLMRATGATAPWTGLEGNLPVHLESGLLARVPTEDGLLLAGFALTPYDETRRRSEQGGSMLSRADPVSLAGAAAFLVLLGFAGVRAALWLARRARPEDSKKEAARRSH